MQLCLDIVLREQYQDIQTMDSAKTRGGNATYYFIDYDLAVVEAHGFIVPLGNRS
jgi:hypothetical protein